MKNKKFRILSIAACLTMTLLFAGCSGEKKDTLTALSSSGETDAAENAAEGVTCPSEDITMEDILNELQIYDGDIKSIDLNQQITVSVDIPAGEMADITVCKFVPDTSGFYDMEVSVPKDCGGQTYISIIDQNSNILNEFPDTSAGMLIGQQYFLVFYTEADAPDKEVSFEVTGTLKFMDAMVDFQELEAGKNRFSIETESEKVAAFSPEESGYYRFDVHCLDSDHGTAAIDAVLREGGEDIYGGLDLFYMDKGVTYFIVYGVYEAGTEEADVCIDIEPFDVMELEDQKTITTDKNVILMCTAKTEDAILVYSVSDGDPKAVVYNQEFDVVAENSDADGLFSDNDHDFALLILAETGNDYYIVVDHVDGHTCEIHLENAEM